MDDSCAEMNSCMPSDKQSPQSLDLEAEAPRTKIKIQDVPVTVAQKVTSALGEKIDKFGNHFREVFSNLFESSREKLAEHSILII